MCESENESESENDDECTIDDVYSNPKKTFFHNQEHGLAEETT
jgi:hypothetical protein